MSSNTRADEFQEEQEFESRVRRTGGLLWSNPFSGPTFIDGRERDAIFVLDREIHIIECTVSRRKDKAISDCKKLAQLCARFNTQPENRLKTVRGWFITRDDVTAEQREVVNSYNGLIIGASFRQFASQIIDASTYLDLRRKYRFGSARDPRTDSPFTDFSYVEPNILSSDSSAWGLTKILAELESGQHFLLLGDYGTGKSSTMRELFVRLAQAHQKAQSEKFPVYLNLNDHFGQVDAAEALIRHAQRIGYSHPEHLVRAWRAGNVILLLDRSLLLVGSALLPPYATSGMSQCVSCEPSSLTTPMTPD